MSLLLSTAGRDLRVLPPEAAAPTEVRSRVFLPPPEVLSQFRPQPPPPPAPRPVPTPPPPAQGGKDRISIGAPSDQRAEKLILRREDDLTKTPKGSREGDGSEQVRQARADTPPKPVAQPTPFQLDGASEPRKEAGLRLPLPPGAGTVPAGPPRDASARPLSSTVQESVERRLRAAGPSGLASGTGRQMGPLFFDDQGADFTLWFNHFKNEVYRNWIVPQAAMMGFAGHVDITFTLDRAGKITDLRLVKSAGTPSLDRAAQNALLGSQLLALPADFAPRSVTMAVSFYYGEAPVS